MPKCPFCNHYMSTGDKECYNCGYNREDFVKDVKGGDCTTAIIILVVSALRKPVSRKPTALVMG